MQNTIALDQVEALDGATPSLSSPDAPPPPPRPPAPPQPPAPARGIEYRSFDGSGNNMLHPTTNVAGSDFTRFTPANFADGVDAIATGLPNARTVSNIVVAGDGDVPNKEGLSGMMYAWGQFVDHDLDLTFSDGKTDISIAIPAGDPVLGASTITMTRSIIDPATGKNGIAATAVNQITGWLDGSQVYGSDAATAASLRTADGHMKTSDGNNLPIVNGAYVAGDIRVQENPDLTALQTLFVREHNYQVDQLRLQHPDWTGDQLYNQARAIVTAEIAHITYSEFLPHLLGADTLTAYRGYNPNVNASIAEEFAGAAFRFGHSIVSAELTKIDDQGRETGFTSLKDAFFQSTDWFAAEGGADGLLRHLSSDLSNALDVHIVDDLRNFLDVPPVAMDLAAINIQRGRDLGLGSLNQTRAALGLKQYASFEEISSDATTVAALKAAYGSVDRIDLWVGGLAEDHAAGAMVGQTFQLIIAHQFENLRDGDRLWFENQGFDRQTLNQIETTSLSDIMLRNTDTRYMQADAFVYYDRHTGLAGGLAAEDPDAPQLVVGNDGVDTLLGGPQNDILIAGAGVQILTGGAGADLFRFVHGPVVATITDFVVGRDHLEFDRLGAASFRDLRLHNDHGNAIIEFGASRITLVGVDATRVTSLDVTFA